MPHNQMLESFPDALLLELIQLSDSQHQDVRFLLRGEMPHNQMLESFPDALLLELIQLSDSQY